MNNYQQSSYGNIQLFVQSEVSAIKYVDEPRIELERTLFGRKFVVYGFALDANEH